MYARRGSLDGERAEEPLRRRPRAETPADVVVSLQQAGGNQAVTRMLGGSRAVLARYGVRVLMDAQAQAPVVTGIDVIGRPKLRLIPGGEGSHVTAWAVFADIVRRAIVGQQLDAATATMKQMLRDQRASLDGEWTGAKPGPVTAALAQADTALAGPRRTAPRRQALPAAGDDRRVPDAAQPAAGHGGDDRQGAGDRRGRAGPPEHAAAVRGQRPGERRCASHGDLRADRLARARRSSATFASRAGWRPASTRPMGSGSARRSCAGSRTSPPPIRAHTRRRSRTRAS